MIYPPPKIKISSFLFSPPFFFYSLQIPFFDAFDSLFRKSTLSNIGCTPAWWSKRAWFHQASLKHRSDLSRSSSKRTSVHGSQESQSFLLIKDAEGTFEASVPDSKVDLRKETCGKWICRMLSLQRSWQKESKRRGVRHDAVKSM
jgi:hypothetical protein